MSKLQQTLSLFLFFVTISAQNSSLYPNCPTHNCGGISIRYPFYRSTVSQTTATPSLCGYQGFQINCSTIHGTDLPIMTLSGHSYQVRNITYENRSIILADNEILNAKNCPRVTRNISSPPLSFYFSESNVNLSFHFNCTGFPPFASDIPCLNYGSRNSCVHIMIPNTESFDWSVYKCDEEVKTTVLDVMRPGMIGTDFGRALMTGFELKWQTSEICGKCEDSNGRCGFGYSKADFVCICSGGRTTAGNCKKGSKISRKMKIVIGVGSAVLSIGLILMIHYVMKSSSYKTEDDRSVEAFVKQYGSLSTKRYKYGDIKKMTNSFKVKLGQGGFGTVFKGKLSDGRLVAVKVLNSSKASGQDFINEVASMGKTSHVNILTLLGFCFDNQRRALVYEYMQNGSLEKFIRCNGALKPSEILGVEMMYVISLGIARGLDYLHRGCNTRILHLDIKPHNILLDENFCPKIADFGLAKLYSKKESIVSMLEARGTIGYIAPEVFYRNFGGVSHKSDVYSYGMLMLEMIGGRENDDSGAASEQSNNVYFPYNIYDRLEKDEFILDGVMTKQENDYVRKMTIVGLWCIQADPKQRPSINEVIEMLEGSMEMLDIPPKPFFSSPPRSQDNMFFESHSGLGSS